MTTVYNKFNRGVIDSLALAREDVTRVSDSAREMHNFIPMRLGPMMYRPGFEYIGDVISNDVHIIPFFGGINNTALLEFTGQSLQIWTDNQLVSSTSVTTSVTNGEFTSNITGWTNNSDPGTTVAWYDGSASLTGDGTGAAQLYQTMTTETGVEHTLTVVVKEAPVELMIGTTGAASDELFKGTLGVGTHSLVFTPDANITITLNNSLNYRTLVDSVTFAGTGTVKFSTSVTSAQLGSIRHAQSADVVFIAYDNGPQFRVERRGDKSWSVVEYRTSYGPFGFINDSEITLTPAAISGNTTLTASKSLFTADSVGEVYKLLSNGQTVESTISTDDDGTNNIRVTGVGTSRQIIINIPAPAGSTVTLQQSTDETNWVDVESYTAATSKTYNDELDNSIVYYRLYIKAGDYGSTPVFMKLAYAGGSIEGVCRVTEYTSSTEVNVQVTQDFGSTDPTRNWYVGEWSTTSGYPSSVALYEGRLWFAGKDRIWGSVSDEFTSFDDTLEGINRSIARTIGFGPVDTVNWLEVSSRLIMGVDSDEISVRSSSFGEILSSTNTNLKSGSSQGVAPIAPVRIDDDIVFVQRAKTRLFNLVYVNTRDTHSATDLNVMNGEIGQGVFKRIVVTRQPETRIMGILEDGTGVILTYDIAEEVQAWSTFTHAAGDIQDIVVLPSLNEDRVYLVVNGRLERMFMYGEATQRPVDSAVVYSSPGTTMTGLSHLEGETVQVWADNANRGTFVVASGQITVPSSWVDVVVGLPYEATYTSNKLSGFAKYSVLTRRKRIEAIGMILEDFYPDSLRYGSSASLLNTMPTQENGKEIDPTVLVQEYDEPCFPFCGSFDTDSRVYLKATGPVKVLALVYEIKESKSLNTSDQ